MKTLLYSTILMSLMIAGAGCHSTERLLDEGRYDELLNLAERRMSGKSLKKEKYVLLAEEAFRKVTDQDMARIERLKSGNRSEDWREIVAIAERIERRQARMEPFLPLVAKNGYKATFAFVKSFDIIDYAENRLITKLYEEGLGYLRNGRAGDKASAQAAYERFQEVIRYNTDFRDVITLRDEARTLGVKRVLMTVDNKARAEMPGYVADILEEIPVGRNAFWTQYYTQAQEDRSMDYIARFVIEAIELGPEVIREEEIRRQKKIEDGWDYVLDANGNVTKDTAGNDIKIPRYREVRAVVLKTHQEKGVYLRGRVELEDVRTGDIVETRPVHVESRFYHQAQSFYGDERALEQGDRVYVALVSFPNDASMMLDIAELARPAFARELEKSRYL